METFLARLDKNSSSALYLQLYEHIKNEILAGRIKDFEKLPSKRKLSYELKVSVNTVQSAYEQLEAEGYIQAKERSGFYVVPFEKVRFTPSNDYINSADEEKNEGYEFSFGTDGVDMSAFPYNTWGRLLRKAFSDKNCFLEKGDSRGDLPLREALCSLLHRLRGVKCDASQIIVGGGSEYLISLITGLVGTDKIFAVENPCYNKTRDIYANNGVRLEYVDIDSDGVDVEKLQNKKIDAVHITPSHQFPMGCVMPISRRTALLNWANENSAYIIEDDYDSEFRYGGRPIASMQGMDKNERVIYLTTFSKSISPSFRLSVLVLPKHLCVKYSKMFSSYSSTVSRYEQRALENFVSDSYFERHLGRQRKIYKEKRDVLEKAISNCFPKEKINILGDKAGLHLVLQIKNADEKELVNKARNAGIYLNGVSEFLYATHAQCSHAFLVLGYANMSCEDIEKAVKKLSNILPI